MSHEEQKAQHDSVKNIENSVYQISRGQIKGYLITFLSILLGAIGSTATALNWFYHYDANNKATYASKADIDSLKQSNNRVLIQLSVFDNKWEKKAVNDSLNAVAVKTTAEKAREAVYQNSRYIKQQFLEIRLTLYKKTNIHGLIEHKDEQGLHYNQY